MAVHGTLTSLFNELFLDGEACAGLQVDKGVLEEMKTLIKGIRA